MRRVVPLLALVAICAGCTAGNAVPTDPGGRSAAPTSTAPPRPTASPDLESRGPAKLVYSVKTKEKVVFLTIDDGLVEDPELLQYLQDEQIPITVFLTTGTVQNWQYWKDMAPVASIQNHTVRHPSLPTLSKSAQAEEICAANEAITSETGTTPWMMRPPYGAVKATTLAASGACGLDWAVHWSVNMSGSRLQYQTADRSLKPGDIILGHFEEGLRSNLPKVIKNIRKQGFEVARLEDYLKPRGTSKSNAATAPADMEMMSTTESKAYLIAE